MPTALSRSKRRQLVVMDVVESLLNNIPDVFRREGLKMPAKTKACLQRIARRKDEILTAILGAKIMELDRKRYKQYQRTLDRITEIIKKECGGHIDPLVWINAVLVMVEDTRAQIPARNGLRKAWDYLNQSLATLYQHFDADLTATIEQIKGQDLGEKMFQVIE